VSTAPLDRLADFFQYLRANDLPVDNSAVLDVHRLAELGLLADRGRFRHASRACLCRCVDHWQRYDRLFDIWWKPTGQEIDSDGLDDTHDSQANASVVAEQRLLGMAGTSEKQKQEEEFFGAGDFKALSLADFRFMFDPRQMQRIEIMVDEIARRALRRIVRRQRISHRPGQVELRRTLRQSLRYQGLPVELRYRRPARKLQRFVLLLDVSQSMDVYAKLFLRFTRILLSVFHRSEAFAFNTELIELGQGHHRLTESDFEHALNLTSKGWLGGTKISESFEHFNHAHLKRLVDTRTTLVIFSDGCDTAKPERLAAAVEPMQARARRLIWVNPLLGRFEEGQANRWMDPVEPYVDRYLSAHNLESLMILERELLS